MQLNFSPLFAFIWSEYMTCTSQVSPSEYYDECERPYLVWVFVLPCILSWFMKFKIALCPQKMIKKRFIFAFAIIPFTKVVRGGEGGI